MESEHGHMGSTKLTDRNRKDTRVEVLPPCSRFKRDNCPNRTKLELEFNDGGQGFRGFRAPKLSMPIVVYILPEDAHLIAHTSMLWQFHASALAVEPIDSWEQGLQSPIWNTGILKHT